MNKAVSLDALLACAVAASQETGHHALRNFSRRNEVLKTYAHDVKLRLDVECQQIATRCIHSHFPGHLLLGEEDPEDTVSQADSNAYEWIIDPIDGTVNFSHGLPFWCCSIAVRQGDLTLAGAVFAPALGLLYTATDQSVAKLNDTEIHVSTHTTAAESVVLTGIDKSSLPGQPTFANFERISAVVQKTRGLGSAALDLCHVAAGCADAYFENGIYIWDVAAGGLIVRRAGGQAERLRQIDPRRIAYLASNGHIQNQLKTMIQL
jgi:myo-inositol-1(or 4)-monophosphatase